ncbi:hypothetical protein M9434_003917 [Picochlorum sp. BPE23]|nr:hypothetical protein M9434_003917 [Picochlorum sp. BPE23]
MGIGASSPKKNFGKAGSERQLDESLVIRLLDKDDYSKGYLTLLSQLTTVGEYSKEQFQQRWEEINARSDTYRIYVIEDTAKNTIIGTATLLVELKFIRGCNSCGHIEDVVVDSSYRGKQLGKRLIDRLREDAKEMKCYKIILDCSESNQAFYEKCGLQRKEIQMVEYLSA